MWFRKDALPILDENSRTKYIATGSTRLRTGLLGVYVPRQCSVVLKPLRRHASKNAPSRGDLYWRQRKPLPPDQRRSLRGKGALSDIAARRTRELGGSTDATTAISRYGDSTVAGHRRAPQRGGQMARRPRRASMPTAARPRSNTIVVGSGTGAEMTRATRARFTLAWAEVVSSPRKTALGML